MRNASVHLPRVGPKLALGLRGFMKLDHRRVEAIINRLLEACALGDVQLMRTAWRALDEALCGHMAAEERYAFPAFARAHPQEALALEREHADLRRSLDDVGILVDLHAASRPAIETVLLLHREHATREERLFYSWAAREIIDAPHARSAS